jgi:hypothetical protein
MEGWKPPSEFDHDKTGFPLTGRHKNVQCARCHQEITDNMYIEDKTFLKFTGLPHQACTNCHRDVHQNKFGQNCTECHNTSGWANYESQNFNHSQTKYPLEGRHGSVPCKKCHTPAKQFGSLVYERCLDCHTDYHQGRFINRVSNGDCSECHSVEGFRPVLYTVNEHNKTSFMLEGGHLAIPCNACHYKINVNTAYESVKFDFPTAHCNDCHNDVHSGTLTKYLSHNGCESCHSSQSWRTMQFNHQQTGFSLEFKHASVSCLSCHQQKNDGVILLSSLSPDCINCHQDPHFKQFAEAQAGNSSATNCAKCHIPKNWKANKFDHNLHSSFKLEGAHENLSCDRCHPTEIQAGMQFMRFKPIPNNCVDCHGKRDKMKDNRDA